MPRRSRYNIAGVPQLAEHLCHDNAALFRSELDKDTFLACLFDAAIETRCDVHAFALLPSRCMLLCTPHEPDSLSRMLQSASRQFVLDYNRRMNRAGAFWSGRHSAALVDPDHYMLVAYRFVDTLPYRSGAEDALGNYAWGSLGANMGKSRRWPLAEHPAFSKAYPDANARGRGYAASCAQFIHAADLGRMSRLVRSSRVLGDEAFQQLLATEHGVTVPNARPGRPRRTTPAPATPLQPRLRRASARPARIESTT